MGEVQDRQGTGYPGKHVGVGGISLEHAEAIAEQLAVDTMADHESTEVTADPHPQYATDEALEDAVATATRFVSYYRWGA